MLPVLVVAERNTKSVAVAIYEINPSWARVCDGFFIEMTIILRYNSYDNNNQITIKHFQIACR